VDKPPAASPWSSIYTVQQIRAYMSMHSLTCTTMSRFLKIPHYTISRWLNGRNTIPSAQRWDVYRKLRKAKSVYSNPGSDEGIGSGWDLHTLMAVSPVLRNVPTHERFAWLTAVGAAVSTMLESLLARQAVAGMRLVAYYAGELSSVVLEFTVNMRLTCRVTLAFAPEDAAVMHAEVSDSATSLPFLTEANMPLLEVSLVKLSKRLRAHSKDKKMRTASEAKWA